jgi:hypothetical protein
MLCGEESYEVYKLNNQSINQSNKQYQLNNQLNNQIDNQLNKKLINQFHSKSVNIEIKKNTSKDNLTNYNADTYQESLMCNLFDPSKSSPPDEFMIKLYARLNKHINRRNNICS